MDATEDTTTGSLESNQEFDEGEQKQNSDEQLTEAKTYMGDTDDFLDELREGGSEKFATYLATVRNDYVDLESWNQGVNDRSFLHSGVEISWLIDMAVIYGVLWQVEQDERRDSEKTSPEITSD